MKDERFIDFKKQQEWIKKLQRFDRYEWYKRDLRRKRPNRKKGRDLYHGILSYRRRVGQHENNLSFRGMARIYDALRFKAIYHHPELAAKIPDLYERFIYLRFPPYEVFGQMYYKPKPITESIMTQFYHDIGSMSRIKVPPLMVGELAMKQNGKDAVLARVKEARCSDDITFFAKAMYE